MDYDNNNETSSSSLLKNYSTSLYNNLNNLNYEASEVYILNQAIQSIVIISIILVAVVLNLLIIHNIWKNELKMHSVNFLLIKNLCLVDFVGAILILPFPLTATLKGVWDFGDAFCQANRSV